MVEKLSPRLAFSLLAEHYNQVTDFFGPIDTLPAKAEFQNLRRQAKILAQTSSTLITDDFALTMGNFLRNLIDRTRSWKEQELRKTSDLLHELIGNFLVHLNKFLHEPLPGKKIKQCLKQILDKEFTEIRGILRYLRPEWSATKKSQILRDIVKRLNQSRLNLAQILKTKTNEFNTYDLARELRSFFTKGISRTLDEALEENTKTT